MSNEKWYFSFLFFFHEREREREHLRRLGAKGEEERESQADSPLSGEPGVGLDPRSLGSWPEPKADT